MHHPFQITRKDLQSACETCCADTLMNAKGDYDDTAKLGVARMIVARSRAPNLRDKLCRTTLSQARDGHKVSDYIYHLKRGTLPSASATS